MSSLSTNDDNERLDFPPAEILDALLEVAIDASKRAGDIILGNACGAEVSERKANNRDLLTLIDPLCEKVCRAFFSCDELFDSLYNLLQL